jgi:hypothetical protein
MFSLPMKSRFGASGKAMQESGDKNVKLTQRL